MHQPIPLNAQPPHLHQPSPFKTEPLLIVIAESASANAKLDLDISLLESSVLIKDENGGDSENVVENDRSEIHITKEEVFHLSRASASRKNFTANLVRKIFYSGGESFKQRQVGAG